MPPSRHPPSLCLLANAPVPLTIGGATYRARTLTLGALAELLAWLDDRLPPPEDGAPLAFASEPAQLALATSDGLAVLLHLSLLPCHPGLTREDAARLAGTLDDDGSRRLVAVAFRRRASRPEPGAGVDPDGHRSDLALADWPGTFHHLHEECGLDYAAISRLTLDQLDNILERGRGYAGYGDPAEHAADGSEWVPGRPISRREMQRLWEAARATDDDTGPKPDDSGTTPESESESESESAPD